MSFAFRQKILFRHCDPDGLVFYPRLVEIINDGVEAMFAEALEWPFEEMLQTGGTPTVRLELEFQAPVLHGEALELTITPVRIGRSSLELTHAARVAGAPRFHARHVLVRIGAQAPRRPEPWPEPVRARLEQMMKGQA